MTDTCVSVFLFFSARETKSLMLLSELKKKKKRWFQVEKQVKDVWQPPLPAPENVNIYRNSYHNALIAWQQSSVNN